MENEAPFYCLIPHSLGFVGNNNYKNLGLITSIDLRSLSGELSSESTKEGMSSPNALRETGFTQNTRGFKERLVQTVCSRNPNKTLIMTRKSTKPIWRRFQRSQTGNPWVKRSWLLCFLVFQC